MKKKYLFLILLLFIVPNRVCADTCSDEEISKLKVLTKNVNITYEYLDADDDSLDWGNNIPYGYDYAITVSGINENIFFISDGFDFQDFRFSDTSEGNITYYIKNDNNDLVIKFYPEICDTEYSLRTENLSLPILNEYYNTSECREIRNMGINLDVCNKTIDKNSKVSDSKFYEIVNKYFEKEKNYSFMDNIMVWISNPYIVICIVFIGVFLISIIAFAIYRFIQRRRLD